MSLTQAKNGKRNELLLLQAKNGVHALIRGDDNRVLYRGNWKGASRWCLWKKKYIYIYHRWGQPQTKKEIAPPQVKSYAIEGRIVALASLVYEAFRTPTRERILMEMLLGDIIMRPPRIMASFSVYNKLYYVLCYRSR